jgi:replicative DNA helicase
MLVANDLMERGKLDAAGGLSYLFAMRDGGPIASSIDSYIGTLKEKSALRKILNFASVLTKHCQLGTAGADAMREQISGFAVTLTESVAKENRPISTRDLIDAIGVQELLKPRRAEGLAIPWRRLNGALSGLNPSTMTVLAAYTGRGKTSMALQIATHAAKSGKAALYWTMEMAPAALFRRLVTQLSGVNARSAEPTFSERQLESDACARLYDEPVYFDRHSRTVAGFRSSIAQVQAKTRLGLVVVDYLQLIRASGRAESRTREVGENSRSLKLSAMDFNLPFLVLSQFSRPDEKKPATIHSLKESGDIENDADAILLLNAPEFGGEKEQSCTVNIGKNREGPAGIDVPLMWRPTSQTFHTVEDYR